jgi:hypothetical protein
LHEGQVLVLGDPRFQVPDADGEGDVPFLSWTGYSFNWDDSGGDTVQLSTAYEHRHYMRYLGALRRWDYSIERVALNRSVLEEAFNPALFENRQFLVEVRSKALASNRYKNAIAAEQQIVMVEKRQYTSQEHILLGPVILLPNVGIHPDEAISIILSDVCGIELRNITPPWAETLLVPGQAAVDQRITALKEREKEILGQLQATESERDRLREPIRLLYDAGTALEEVVRSALRSLGAVVRKPDNEGAEDGWIAYASEGLLYEAVLEIKSTAKPQFDEYGLKQVVQWQQKGIIERGIRYTPLFVGVASRDVPPAMRPIPFGESLVKKAELFGVALLSTEDLYRALFLHAHGRLDVDHFWSDLAATRGLYSAEELRDAFASFAGPSEDPWAGT